MDIGFISHDSYRTWMTTRCTHTRWVAQGVWCVVLLLVLALFYTVSAQELRQGMRLRDAVPLASEINKKYRDAGYAQEIWDKVRSRAEFDAERRNYADYFDPWFEFWQENPVAAMQDITAFAPNSPNGFWAELWAGSENRRQKAILRGFDLQLLFEDFQERYQKWRHNAKMFIRENDAPSSSGSLDLSRFFGPRPCMKPRQESIFECGLPPDWRTAAEKIEDGHIVIAVEKSRRKRAVASRLHDFRGILAEKMLSMARDLEICERKTAAVHTSQQRDAACARAVTDKDEVDILKRELEILTDEVGILEHDLDGLKQKIRLTEP